MFYLFVCTAILINTFMDLSAVETLLLWMALFCCHLGTSYLGIVKSSERVKHKLRNEYRSKIDEIQQELLNTQPAQNRPAIALPGKKKAAAH